MSNFITLYLYELKKICKRKIVWITLSILIGFTVFMGLADALTRLYTMTVGENNVTLNGFEYLAYAKENAMSISGRKIDASMLEEVKAAYAGMHEVEAAGGAPEETDRDKMSIGMDKYKGIFQFITDVTGNAEAVHSISEEMIYQERADALQEIWTEQKLSEEEKAYWLEKEYEIDRPFVFGYAGGWETMLEGFLSLIFMLVLAITICLSNVFSEEHVRKTDQLILCSRFGRKLLYFSKVAAGVTFGLCCGAAMLLAAVVSVACVYGLEGFDVAVQIYLPSCSWSMTIGQAALLMGAVYLAAGILCSVTAMFLSEVTRNSIAVMGIMTGSMFLTMFVNIPCQLRALSQIYELLPTVLLRVWQLWDDRLVSIFGLKFANFQIAPLLYLVISLWLIIWGKHKYKNYQVTGR